MKKKIYDILYSYIEQKIIKDNSSIVKTISTEEYYKLLEEKTKRNMPTIIVTEPIIDCELLVGYPTKITFTSEKEISFTEILELLPNSIKNDYFNKYKNFRDILISTNLNTTIIVFKFLYSE